MHLDEAQVHGLLHGELARPGELAAREHLEQCTTCRDRVAAARREEADVFALLGAVDHPAPAIELSAIEVRARTVDGRPLRWAAGIVLSLGVAGAAYAAPGSPLPELVRAIASWVTPGDDVAQARSSGAANPASRVAGVAMVPGEKLFIVFTSTQARGEARVRLTDSAEVVVRAPGGAATFLSADVDRLVIDNRGGASSFDIEIPRVAAMVEIVVNDERRFRVERAVASGSAPVGEGEYVIPLQD